MQNLTREIFFLLANHWIIQQLRIKFLTLTTESYIESSFLRRAISEWFQY